MESSTITPAAGRAVDAPTLTEALRRTAANHPEVVAVRMPDDSISLTWSEVLARVDALAGGLAKLGVQRGDTVAIMLGNRPEFHIADLAVAMLGATPFSIYVTYPAEEIVYLCTDAATRVAIVEQTFLPVVLEARKSLPALEHVIVIDGEAQPDDSGVARSGEAGGRARGMPEGTVSLAEVEGSNPGFDVAAAAAQIAPDDVVTLIYTSGTTGPPRASSSRTTTSWSRLTRSTRSSPSRPGARVISWLPAAHIAERMAHHYIPVIYAGTITCCPNPREIAFLPAPGPPDMVLRRPAHLGEAQGGPRDHAGRPARGTAPGGAAGNDRGRRSACASGSSASRCPMSSRRRWRAPTSRCSPSCARCSASIRSLAVNVGAAPTPIEVLEFFHAMGIELAELWGMSETCGFGTCNRPGEVKIGTVGPASPGVELKIADDGELLVRGDFVMLGYRNQPETTADALDSEGWLHTGDIGQIDDEGFLKIVDRKKEIIINAAGKNMSPANIEAAIKSGSPLIGQAVTIGDARPYNTALSCSTPTTRPIGPNSRASRAGPWRPWPTTPSCARPCRPASTRPTAIWPASSRSRNSHIVRGDWAPGGDELTPTMKLKRRPIAAKYEAEIESMYAG